MKTVIWYLVIIGFVSSKEKETSIPLKSTFEEGAIEEGVTHLIEHLRRYGRTGVIPFGFKLKADLPLEEVATEYPRVQLVRKSTDGEIVLRSAYDFRGIIDQHRPTAVSSGVAA